MNPHRKKSISRRLLDRLCLTESWVIFFLLGIIMMNYPFIAIFNKKMNILGIPLLFLYYYIGWFVSILVIYLFTKAKKVNEQDRKNRGEQR